MDQEKQFHAPKLGWTLEDLAHSLSVSVPFLRLEVKCSRETDLFSFILKT
jgi:hypothetical protein